MKQKINFTATYGEKLLKFKNVTIYQSKEGSGYVPMQGTSSVIRQFVKQVFPEIDFRISSKTYSGGDSVRIHLQKQVSVEKLRELESVLFNFQSGTFNGMIDMYEYDKNRGISITKNGTKFTFETKYLFVCNEPKYGTPEWDEYWENQKKVK